MKSISSLTFLLICRMTFAQPELPAFLLGTWKTENKEKYERWDKPHANIKKGYTTVVLNQNKGRLLILN